jgi:quinol monooxygenase YgiN
MYGLIRKMKAITGQRDVLIAILLKGIQGAPACISYVIARDPADEDVVWITEVWDSRESQRASSSSPQMQRAVARSKAFTAGYGEHFEIEPIGGHGVQFLQRDPTTAQACADRFGAVGHVQFCVDR